MPAISPITNTFYIYTLAVGANALSSTSGLYIGNDRPTLWSMEVPSYTAFAITATCNVKLLGSVDDITYRVIGYSNNPSTATSGFRAWEVPADGSNAFVLCEAAQFVPYVKALLTNTATVAVEFRLVGKPI